MTRGRYGEIFDLVPRPKVMTQVDTGTFKIGATLSYQTKAYGEEIQTWHKVWLAGCFKLEVAGQKPTLVFVRQDKFSPQQYKLTITKSEIKIEYQYKEGIYYAMLMLHKLYHLYEGELPCVQIVDWPDIQKRGLLFDISRGKIPKLEGLIELVDLLALLQYNELQLYIEGPVFDYESIRWQGKDKTQLITKEEIKYLQAYCKERCIKLIANQNVLGHMKGWLQLEPYKKFSEKPDDSNCTTLNINDPQAVDFAKTLIKDILRCYDSNVINVNLDEPEELGQGASLERVQLQGKDNVYLEYVDEIHQYVTSLNRKMMMWADVIERYPNILKKLPKDIVLLQWGYEAQYDFKKYAKRLKDWGGEFYLCPGTSSWLSFSGRYENMIQNVSRAIEAAKEQKGNILLTDWGDGGHMQHPYVSYLAYIFAGNGMWHEKEKNKVDLEKYLSHLLGDKANRVGQIIKALGNYYLYEGVKAPNQTSLFNMYTTGYIYNKIYENEISLAIGRLSEKATRQQEENVWACITPYEQEKIHKLISWAQGEVECLQLSKVVVKKEIISTLNWIKLCLYMDDFIRQEYKVSRIKRLEKIKMILKTIDQIEEMDTVLWQQRNKPSGLQNILGQLAYIRKLYLDKKQEIDKGFVYNILDHIKTYRNYRAYLHKSNTIENKKYKQLYKKAVERGKKL